MIKRVFVEKKQGFDVEARRLQHELADFFGEMYPELTELKGARLLRRYDAELLDEEQFKKAAAVVFSEPQCDQIFYGTEIPLNKNERCFGVEYSPGQYDQRADSAEQCAELIAGLRPRIKIADFYVFEGKDKPLSDAALGAVKKFFINPVHAREASAEFPSTLEIGGAKAQDVPVLNGFIAMDAAGLEKLTKQYGLAMSMEDLLFCRDYFAGESRDPTLAELKVLDTYWSDHCRHTTFNTILEEINLAGGKEVSGEAGSLKKALELYEETRREVYGANAESRKRSLMDMATIGTKKLKQKGLVADLDESPEVNACTVKINAEFSDGTSEPWLFLFKNETHNHPTEIEPLGGASTCLGGAIRDPLSGRAIVYQAMRIIGGGDPKTAFKDTLPGKLPQLQLAHIAADGYSSYGNQIGLCSGQLTEFYHPGFLAKRMEMGALVGAVPQSWVQREEPLPGDVVLLVGSKTGRDGIGGATSSSKVETGKSKEIIGAEVPKGSALEERKILRLFRKPEVSRLIKRCNDFGAGGVSVAVSELVAGLDIDLDAVQERYPGLDGMELAISESQERMAVVTSAADAQTFIKAAAAENLEAVILAKVTDNIETEEKARLRMNWRGKTIVDLSRKFLNSSGAPKKAKVLLKAGQSSSSKDDPSKLPAGVLLDNLERELASLRSGSRRGVAERFDGSIGAASVLFPWGGGEQGTPECGMAALLPDSQTLKPSGARQSMTASLMTFGYDPFLMSMDTYKGAKGSVLEALAKFACLGGDPFKSRLSFQEYFERPVDGETWGKPAAALLGALEAQLRLEVPAIGGKDSMSGNYKDEARGINITVPPTLAAFAAGIVAAQKVRSGALSGRSGNAIILLSQSPRVPADEWEVFKANMKTIEALASSGALKAAYPVGAAGVAATLAVMAFGNMCGVEAYADSFSAVDPVSYQGSVLAEIDEAAVPAKMGSPWILAGRTLGEKIFRIARATVKNSGKNENAEAGAAEISLEVLRRAYEYPLARVYPQTSTGATVAEHSSGSAVSETLKTPAFKPAGNTHTHTHSSTHGTPLVVMPVFPGTNGEWDMEKAFREAGAKTRFVIIRNRPGDSVKGRPEDIADSLKELAAAFSEAQIIAFSGGYSSSEDPDGSGRFIANVIRSPLIAASITDFLEKRDGLILGISNGFQALIKTGLVPYGRIITMDDSSPTLSTNTIGRHVSRMVRTRVMPNISPWLSLEQHGNIHVVPVSHGEGRVVIRREEAEALFAAGQVPFCYADAAGNPTMAEPDNPNGSALAIESLTSPDGRVMGKMSHPERSGKFVHINIPGNKNLRIFEAGVNYFK